MTWQSVQMAHHYARGIDFGSEGDCSAVACAVDVHGRLSSGCEEGMPRLQCYRCLTPMADERSDALALDMTVASRDAAVTSGNQGRRHSAQPPHEAKGGDFSSQRWG